LDEEQVKEGHRFFGVELNNRAWDLIGKPGRTEEENLEMVAAAMGSWFHWSRVGTEVNVARADGTVSRAYSTIGEGRQALHFAERYRRSCATGTGIEDWDHAFSAAAVARAFAALGDRAQWQVTYDQAVKAGSLIHSDEDRQIFQDDMLLEPWFGMSVSRKAP
jgi:hypothetical protein